MAPSVCDEPSETSLPTALTEDCLGVAQTHSCDETFETASLTLDNSRSFSDDDDDDDFDQQLLLQEPTDNELLLQITDGSEDEMVTAVEAVWRQDSIDIASYPIRSAVAHRQLSITSPRITYRQWKDSFRPYDGDGAWGHR